MPIMHLNYWLIVQNPSFGENLLSMANNNAIASWPNRYFSTSHSLGSELGSSMATKKEEDVDEVTVESSVVVLMLANAQEEKRERAHNT